jgi:hypothetical protein
MPARCHGYIFLLRRKFDATNQQNLQWRCLYNRSILRSRLREPDGNTAQGSRIDHGYILRPPNHSHNNAPTLYLLIMRMRKLFHFL